MERSEVGTEVRGEEVWVREVGGGKVGRQGRWGGKQGGCKIHASNTAELPIMSFLLS